MAGQPERHLFRRVRVAGADPGGPMRDLTVQDGRVAAVEPVGRPPEPGTHVHDLPGWLVTPSLVEPHAHLDKVLTARLAANPAGDLDGAIRAWTAARDQVTAADVRARALAVIARQAAHGVTAIRTHVDTGLGLPAVEALVALRQELAPLLDLQVVAGHGLPVTGPQGTAQRAALLAALRVGADGVGGAPSLDPDPVAAFEALARIAEDAGVPLDLHVDETLDPQVFLLGQVARRARDLSVPLTVGHVVSLATQPERVRRTVAEQLAAAGVAVVTLPQTNLYLQGRGTDPLRPRGLTATHDLLAAGVTLAGGSDNIADSFNPLGRADPLETASLLVAAGHLSPQEAFAAVTDQARLAIGRPVTTVRVGQPADLLIAPAHDVGDLLATAPAERLVLRHGRLVATTTVSRTWSGSALLDPDTIDTRAIDTAGSET